MSECDLLTKNIMANILPAITNKIMRHFLFSLGALLWKGQRANEVSANEDSAWKQFAFSGGFWVVQLFAKKLKIACKQLTIW